MAFRDRRSLLGGGLVAGLALPASAAPPPAADAPPLTIEKLSSLVAAAGLHAMRRGDLLQIEIDEKEAGYKAMLELQPSERGEWLHLRLHLAPVEDLTRLPSAPLLNLLAANDRLLGMAFAYHGPGGRLLLHASVPGYGLNAGAVAAMVEGIRRTALETHGLWDTSRW